jgi:hypothetical protein
VPAIDLAVQTKGKLSLARHPIDGETIALPVNRFTGLKGTVHLHAFYP